MKALTAIITKTMFFFKFLVSSYSIITMYFVIHIFLLVLDKTDLQARFK